MKGDKMKTETFLLMVLALTLFYSVYSYVKNQKTRIIKANEVVGELNTKMKDLSNLIEQEKNRRIGSHLNLEKQIKANEQSIGTVGKELIKLARVIDEKNIEAKAVLDRIDAAVRSLKSGVNVHVKSVPKRKRQRKQKQ